MIGPGKKARILVVEDGLDIQLIYNALLSPAFDVQLTSSVQDALQAAAQQSFDLFLLDFHLGEKRTGVDLLGLLRQMPGYRSTPAIACTASASMIGRRYFLSSGFNEYVAKPFNPLHLYATIETALA